MRTKTKLAGTLALITALGLLQARAQCCGCCGGARAGAGGRGFGPPGAAAQGSAGRGADAWGAAGQYGRVYDPKTVETVTGEVLSVEQVTPAGYRSSGVHLQLKTAHGTLAVHLGPSWYLDNQEAAIAAKDKIEVTGSRVTLDGSLVLIAAEVKKADGVLKLRDQNGVPLWAGWRKR